MGEFQGQRRNYIDSLRLSPRELDGLLTELDRQGAHLARHDRRREERLTYRQAPGVIVQLRHPGGSSVNYLVTPRNLSRHGLGFLHGSFVHHLTPCTLLLPTLQDQVVRIEGKVVACRFLRGHVHEVGIRFDEAVNLRDFIATGSPADDCASTELPALRGAVLYVEDSVDDQELMGFILRQAGVKVSTVGNGAEALERAASAAYNLIITDICLPGMNGADLAAALRRQGYAGPIVAITAEDDPQVQAEALSKGCVALLHKPCQADELVRVLAKHLPAASAEDDAVLLSTKWADARMRQLILAYLQRLEQRVQDLANVLGGEPDPTLLRRLCLDLKGSAGGYGYTPISQAAQRLLQLTDQQAPIDDLRRQFGDLVRLTAAALRVRTSGQ